MLPARSPSAEPRPAESFSQDGREGENDCPRRPADCRAGLVLGQAVQREGGCSSHKAALKRGRPRSSPEPGGPGTGNVRVHDSVLMSTNRDPMITRRHATSRVRIEKISDLSQVVWTSRVGA